MFVASEPEEENGKSQVEPPEYGCVSAGRGKCPERGD